MPSRELFPLEGTVQHGYVTNDFERAKEFFATSYGLKRFLEMRHLPTMMGPNRNAVLSIGLAYFGDLMIEIIQPESGDCDIYREILPQSGFAVRLHHHGFILHSDDKNPHEKAKALRDSYAARGAHIVLDGQNPRSGNIYFYADTRAELGHYVEYISLTSQGVRDYAATIPNNCTA